MPTTFDPGYTQPAFQSLVDQAPDSTVYPFAAFRFEWGPIFHRGRLDGTSRVLCIGQDPAQHETVARRILIGTAGRRAQGFVSKLGFNRSYTLINTFLYSVYGQTGGNQHVSDPAITAYRNKWFAAVIANSSLEAVVAFGTLADTAWSKFLADPANAAAKKLPYQHVPHPTSPEGQGGSAATIAAATKQMLQKWNTAIQALRPQIKHPDVNSAFVPYGDAFTPADLVQIPRFDFPAGTPTWMCDDDGWATRTGATAADKRRTITVEVPTGIIP